jgi:hypothetical protein
LDQAARTATISIDGKEPAKASREELAQPIPGVRLTVGHTGREENEWFSGLLVELLIYDRCLGGGELEQATRHLKEKYRL